jgi:hypothetical protein
MQGLLYQHPSLPKLGDWLPLLPFPYKEIQLNSNWWAQDYQFIIVAGGR